MLLSRDLKEKCLPKWTKPKSFLPFQSIYMYILANARACLLFQFIERINEIVSDQTTKKTTYVSCFILILSPRRQVTEMYNFLENYSYRNGLGYLIWATLSTSDCFDTEVYFFSPQSIFHLLLVWFEEFCVFDIRNYIFGRVIDGPAISRSLGIAPTGLPPSL